MAGIEASMMTSLGTCKLVMPRSESTMAMPLRYSATSAVKAASSAWPCILLMASPKPLLGFTPRRQTSRRTSQRAGQTTHERHAQK